jgi:hypothetical protein
LRTWYNLSRDFAVVPNAGMGPLHQTISSQEGPYVYCGSMGEDKDLIGLIQAARELQAPLKFIGGTEEEWRLLGEKIDTSGILWEPRVRLRNIPVVLAGARAGLIPTDFDSPSGEFSCPMKLFDYARCGLPVLSTALPAAHGLRHCELSSFKTIMPKPRARGRRSILGRIARRC